MPTGLMLIQTKFIGLRTQNKLKKNKLTKKIIRVYTINFMMTFINKCRNWKIAKINN